MISEKRSAKFEQVVNCRQGNLTVVLENVHDPHNIGAVLRTCDSIGIKEIFVLYTDPNLSIEKLYLGKNASSGARKWIDVHFYTELEPCFAHLRKNYDKILCTHLSEDAKSLHDLDLTASVALVFGNERDGITAESLALADGNFLIPQVGMVQSLNISVACAVSLYEAFRQRNVKGFYTNNTTTTPAEKTALLKEFKRKHEQKFTNNKVKKKG